MTFKERIGIFQGEAFFPKFSTWVLLLFVVVFGFIYNYQSILFLSPQSLHQWRQADCLSITLNYYQDHNGFFQPSIHNLGRDGSGRTVSEFPIVYYLVAQLWSLLGYHEYIFRMFNLLIFFSGLLALLKIFENTLKDSFLAIAFTLLMFTSPMLAFYANNFLVNSAALSLAFIGLYFFYRFYCGSKNKHLYLMAVFFSLAGLLKTTSLLSFVAIFGIYILESFNVQIVPGKKIFQQPKRQILPLVAVFSIEVIWYLYAAHYNEQYNGGIFLIGILPVWDLNSTQVKEVIHAVIDHIHWDYFRRETQVLFLAMFLFLLLFFKRVNRLLFVLTLFLSIGLVFFVVLFFQALKDHDYYTLDMLILIPFIILTFFLFIKEKFRKFSNSLLLRIFIIAFLIHNVDFARRRMRDRYDPNCWQNENYGKIKVFEEITPYLRSIGIRKEDRVISISDGTINVSLYLMDQKGWTHYGILSDSTLIKEKIKLGAKYLLIYNEEPAREDKILPLTKNKIGQFKTVDIFQL